MEERVKVELKGTPVIHDNLKIAVPVVGGRLSAHFGHCEEFILFDVDIEGKKILSQERAPAPPHEPGSFPGWLKEKGAHLIVACGMGSRAQGLFTEKGIDVIIGASSDNPEEVVKDYLDGNLRLGENICDH